jgi:hypothetical protein
MNANLTRYGIRRKHFCNDICPVEVQPDGEWVKFADVMESLSTSHNTRMDEIIAGVETFCKGVRDAKEATYHECELMNRVLVLIDRL